MSIEEIEVRPLDLGEFSSSNGRVALESTDYLDCPVRVEPFRERPPLTVAEATGSPLLPLGEVPAGPSTAV